VEVFVVDLLGVDGGVEVEGEEVAGVRGGGGAEFDGTAERVEGFGEAALVAEEVAEVGEGGGVVGVDGERGAQRLFGFVELADAAEGFAEVGVEGGFIGDELGGAEEVRDGFDVAVLLGEELAEVGVILGVIGRDGDGLGEEAEGFGGFALAVGDDAQHVDGFVVVGLAVEDFAVGAVGLGEVAAREGGEGLLEEVFEGVGHGARGGSGEEVGDADFGLGGGKRSDGIGRL
jgi:hypothetical protein